MNRIVHKVLQHLYLTLRPAARNSLHVALLLTAHDRQPKQVQSFKEKRVLVLAPHADDEVIGCGGAMIKHIRSGAEVMVAYMTDGRLGDAELLAVAMSDIQLQNHQMQLVNTRQQEARACSKLLGVHQILFMGAEDGKLKPDSSNVGKLLSLMREFKPDCIYLPFVMDWHEDHWQTNRVFHATLSLLNVKEIENIICRGYEVWSPVIANRLLNITDVMDLKLAAIDQYQSQLKDVDYKRCIQGMNAFRSIHVGAKGYVEAFFESSVEEYTALFQKICRN